MSSEAKSSRADSADRPGELELSNGSGQQPNLQDPSVVLSLLEADQVVAAKRQTRFGRRKLSVVVRMMLWGLRIYVVAMLVIVVISVWNAIHAAP